MKTKEQEKTLEILRHFLSLHEADEVLGMIVDDSIESSTILARLDDYKLNYKLNSEDYNSTELLSDETINQIINDACIQSCSDMVSFFDNWLPKEAKYDYDDNKIYRALISNVCDAKKDALKADLNLSNNKLFRLALNEWRESENRQYR